MAAPEHFLVQEQQRTERLPVRRHRHLALGGQHRQERFDFRLTQVAGMLQPVELHEELCPSTLSRTAAGFLAIFVSTRAGREIDNAL